MTFEPVIGPGWEFVTLSLRKLVELSRSLAFRKAEYVVFSRGEARLVPLESVRFGSASKSNQAISR